MFPYLCISLLFQDEEEWPPARGHAKPLNRDQLIAVASSAQLQPGPPQGRDTGAQSSSLPAWVWALGRGRVRGFSLYTKREQMFATVEHEMKRMHRANLKDMKREYKHVPLALVQVTHPCSIVILDGSCFLSSLSMLLAAGKSS